MIRVLVCGGRDWDDEVAVELLLNALHAKRSICLVVHGAASGADTMSMQWANRHDVPHRPFPANWSLHGVSAGRKRNRRMLKEKPDVVVAFPGGSGTEDMKSVAARAGVILIEFGGYSHD